MRFVILAMLAGTALAASSNVNINAFDTGGHLLSPGVYQWTYTVAVSDLNKFDGNTTFTIYDLLGFTDATLLAALTTPAGWAASVQDVGVTPLGVMLFDRADAPNVTWTRTDATPLLGNTFVTGFAITTSFAWHQPVQWAALADTVGVPSSVRDSLAQGTAVAPAAIPEPGTSALLGLSLIGLYLRRPRYPTARPIR